MKKERADTGDMDEALEREQEKKRQEEEKKKEQEPEFRKRLSALLEKAGKQDHTITRKELEESFHGLALDDDDWDRISQFLASQDIVIMEGESPDGSDAQGEEEKELSDQELAHITSDIDRKSKDLDDASEEDLEEIEKEEEKEEPRIQESAVSTEDPVRMYLKEIGQIPLLKSEQEISLARRMEDGLAAGKILDQYFTGEDKDTLVSTKEMVEECFHLPEPESGAEDTRPQEYALKQSTLCGKTRKELENIKADGQEARNRLTEANLRLVVSIAKKYVNQGMSFLDLIQEGNTGLIKAVDKFDFRKGFKFSTYATWWIRQAITRAIADQARTIRVPVHMVETVNTIKRVRRQLTTDLGRDPSDEELAKAMDMPLGRLHEIMNETMEATSLDTPVGEEDDSSVGDFVADTSSMSPAEAADYRMLQQRIGEVLNTLTEREQQVLRMRFGLDDGEAHTLEDVGKVFGVTRERIRQIEAKALRKLRHPSRGKKLRDFIDED